MDEIDKLLNFQEGDEEPTPIFVSLGYISENACNSRVFRPASKWRRPINAIGDGTYNLVSKSPIHWIGTTVITKKDWIRSSVSGRQFSLGLLPHFELIKLVNTHRRSILDENSVNSEEEFVSHISKLTQEIEKFKDQYSLLLSTNNIGTGSTESDVPTNSEYDFGTIQLQLRTFVSYPLRTEGALKPLLNVYHREDLKNQFCLASLCCIDVILVENVPPWSDIDIWDIAHSKIHICAVWKHERRILHQGGSALELFPFRCVEISGLPINSQFNDLDTIMKKNMRMKCFFSGRILLTPVPGSEPSIYLYMLLNGKPFSRIKNPISMAKFDSSVSNTCKYDLERIDCSVESVIEEFKTRGRFSGSLECKVIVWPENSKFLSQKEYSYLNLRPQKGIVYNLLHDYQTQMPDHYSAPTLGPYGVWVGYSVNDNEELTETNQQFQDLFGEAIHQMSSTIHNEKSIIAIHDGSGEYFGTNEENSLAVYGIYKSKFSIESPDKIDPEDPLDDKYINGDLKRFNEDKKSSKPYVPHMCTLLGSGVSSGIAGEWITFTIQSRDEDGNRSSVGKSKIHIRLRSVGYIKYTFTAEPYGLEYSNGKSDALITVDEREACRIGIDQIDVPIEWCSVESYHGVYNCRMRCEKAGQYFLRITMDGLPIAGSPYDILITPSNPEPKASSTIGEGTVTCKACPTIEYMTEIPIIKACGGKVPKYINSFIVILCDEFGNRISTGGHQLKAKFNSNIGKIHAIYDNWDGSYVIYYTIHLERAIQNFDQRVLDKIHSISSSKSNSNQISNRKLSSEFEEGHNGISGASTTSRAIEQALGITTRVSASKIDFNSEELKGLFNTKKIQYITDFGEKDEKFLDSEEIIISNICDLEICVYLNNKPIYGSPFTPYIENLCEIRNWYRMVDLNTAESNERKFEKLLESDRFEEAIEVMKTLEKKYVHDFKAILQELEREPTNQEQIMDRVGKISADQENWTLLHNSKQKLEQIIKDNNDRENLLITFGRFLLKRLENQMVRRQKVDSDMSSYRVLKENNLEPLCHSLEVEYNKFQQQRTRELIRLVSLLETNKLNSLEELMELYQLIADELRSLGRGNLANQFDLVNRCLIEEQQLTNIREHLQRKSDILSKMDEIVASRENALNTILENYNQGIKIEEDHIERELSQINVDVLRKLNFNPSTGVQTEDSLSFTDTVVGPLILDRVLGKSSENLNTTNGNKNYFGASNKNGFPENDYATYVLKKYWKPLMEWDLRSFVKILKQCPRISICLKELFSYFSNTKWRINEAQVSIYGDVMNKGEDEGRFENLDIFGHETEGVGNNNGYWNNNSNDTAEAPNSGETSLKSNNNANDEPKSISSKWTVGQPYVTSDDPNLRKFRKAMGITRNGFKRLIVSLNLTEELINSEKTVENLFYKYSTERNSLNFNFGNRNVRVITQELWIPLLRELAYINALIRFDTLRESTLGQNATLRLFKNINDVTGKVDYSVWENNLIGTKYNICNNSGGNGNLNGDSTNMNGYGNTNSQGGGENGKIGTGGHSDSMGRLSHYSMPGVAVTQDNIQDLNRVTAFRHFCELHLIPLYKSVYNNVDFSRMLMLPFSKSSSISISYNDNDDILRGLEVGEFDSLEREIIIREKKDYIANQSTHEKVECKINNCLKIVVSQLKMSIASGIFIQIASKSMKGFEFDITRDLVEHKKASNDDDILKNYNITEFDYIKPLHLYEYLSEIGIIPGHITGGEMHEIVDKVLTSREEYLPKQLPVTYNRSKCLSFPGYIETLAMCISKGIVRKLSGSLWSEGDIRTEVIEHLVLYNLYETTKF
ncbi:Filamin/ABP280 repeat-containing protein [Cryptosporidium felis]|nr:Filamin/ABP280 repeat-containing protein [Cryptosporidium felis]